MAGLCRALTVAFAFMFGFIAHAVELERRSLRQMSLAAVDEGFGTQHAVTVINLANTRGYITYDKYSLDAGAAGFVVKASVLTPLQSSTTATWANDHRVRASTSSLTMLGDLVTNHGGDDVIIKAALTGKEDILVKEMNVNNCLKIKVPTIDYTKYVAHFYGHYFTQCVRSNGRDRIKKVGKSRSTTAALSDALSPIDPSALPRGVCMYLAFEFAGAKTEKAYLDANKDTMSDRDRVKFLTRITKAHLALWHAGFVHGDAHHENILVDRNGDNPKWIDVSGAAIIKPGAGFGGVCASCRDDISKNPTRTIQSAWTVGAGSALAPKDFFQLWERWEKLKTGTNTNCVDFVADRIKRKLERVEQQRIALVLGRDNNFPTTWSQFEDMLDDSFDYALLGASTLKISGLCTLSG